MFNVIEAFFIEMSMKYIYLIFLIFIFIPFSSAIEDNDLSKIYENYEKGIVYVERALYLDSKNIKYHEICERVENIYDLKLVDRYVTIGNGSGFFITSDGYIVTNYHVVDKSNIDKMKESLLERIDRKFISKIPGDIISEYESNRLFVDFRKMIKNSEQVYRVIINQKDAYSAKLVAFDAVLDLALLKIDGSAFQALYLYDPEDLRIGAKVVSIGYPRISISFGIIEEYYSTMTAGYVSSIRPDNWGIQHTSSINPGNSGGPLLDFDGNVIGINVGIDPNANNVNFSIHTNTLISWLNDEGYRDIIIKNKNDLKLTMNKDQNNNKKLIESGNIVFIDLITKNDVFVNNEKVGQTPLLLKGLSEGLNSVKIESEHGFVEKKLNVNNKITKIIRLSPNLEAYKGKLYITTTPSNAKVFIDSICIGSSPVLLNDLDTGEHDILIKLENFAEIKDQVSIEKKSLVEKNYILNKGFKLTLKKVEIKQKIQ